MEIEDLFDYEGEEGRLEITRRLEEAETLFDNFTKDIELFRQYKGFNIAPNFSIPSIEFALSTWKPRKGDVLVASYPKTGTTWTLEIIRRLLHSDDDVFRLFKTLPLSMHILEAGDPPKFHLLDKMSTKNRRVLFSHLPSELINTQAIEEAGAKIVYVLRNPKDQMVSWYHFYQKLPKYTKEPLRSMLSSGWDHFFENFTNGKFSTHNKPGEWYPEHILSWLKYRDKEFVHFVYYEDLYQNQVGEIAKLAKFLNVALTDGEGEKIAEQCSLQSMSKQTREKRPGEIAKTHSLIFRKGQVGGWKQYFSDEQSKIVDEIFDSKLKDTDIHFVEEM